MEKGFNSDVSVGIKKYHVQTEDWGLQNPFIVTRIFCNGAVVNTIKTPYSELTKQSDSYLNKVNVLNDESIRAALRKQHNSVIDGLYSGK